MVSINNLYKKVKRESLYFWYDLFKPNIMLPGCTILCFHGIDELGNTQINSRFLSVNKFSMFIKLCLSKNVEFITVEEAFETDLVQGKFKIALTFDDGYKNNLTHLLPILEYYQIPASIYITPVKSVGMDILWTDCVDVATYIDRSKFDINGELFEYVNTKGYRSTETGVYLKEVAKKADWAYKQLLMKQIPGAVQISLRPDLEIYWKLLSEEDIRALNKSPLITIGSHGLYHNWLALLPLENAKYELMKSKEYLEEIIQSEVEEFAYPGGSYSIPLLESALTIGYKRQVVTKPSGSPITHHSCLARFVTNPHISNYNQLKSMANGKY